jgi:hypothetical protein
MGYAPINGFSAVDYGDPALATYTVPGTSVRVSLRKETAPLFLALMSAWNKEVETLDPKSVWGHAYRAVRGSTSTSFHACGIAVDLNANQHPLGKHPTFTATELAHARTVLARFKYAGQFLFRWGYDYSGRKDDMHVELIVSRATALAAVKALQAVPKPPVAKPFPLKPGQFFGIGGTGTVAQIKAIQAAMNKLGNHLVVDGDFGPATAAIVKRFQTNRRLVADGKVGPKTWALIRF